MTATKQQAAECIREQLLQAAEPKYARFMAGLVPTLPPEHFLGVRTPVLRRLAKTLCRQRPEEAEGFLSDLPHQYFEEEQLHAYLLCLETDFGCALEAVARFLPHVDNWATCDALNPAGFGQNPARLLEQIPHWLASDHTYTRRFGLVMLLYHASGEAFRPEHLDWVCTVTDSILGEPTTPKTEPYYVRMAAAWYFATALVEHETEVTALLREHRLDTWTHNRTIQKAVESFRISEEQKLYLRGLRRRGE